ncbi:hypothetical protein EYR36_005088 [Pleurotus pulmonarius]|nr:hypothetical protein EYR36_005088 [Pleurotus pulmonarius]
MPAKAKPKPRPKPTPRGGNPTKAANNATQEILAQPTVAAAPEATRSIDLAEVEPQYRLQTRKSNQNKHPGEQHNRYSTRRHTKEEIAHDEREKAEKIMAEKYENICEHQSKIDFAAQLESNIRQKQHAIESTAMQPDLALYDTQTEDGIDNEHFSNDISNENLPYTSGDDSEHVSVPGEPYDEDFDDGKGSDPDYVERDDEKLSESDYYESEVENEALRVPSKKPKVTKSHDKVSKAVQRAAFRTVVSQKAKQVAEVHHYDFAEEGEPLQSTASVKRKVDGPDALNVKRAHPADIGGLRPNWKLLIKGEAQHGALASVPAAASTAKHSATAAKVNPKSATAAALPPTNLANTQKNALRLAPRSILYPLASVQVQSTIGPNYVPRSTLQMGIKFEPTDITPAGEVTPIPGTKKGGGKSEAKYTNANLPFSRGRSRLDLKTWQNMYLPELYDWAGTLSEPFGSNSHPKLENIVKELWVKHFPHLKDVEDDPAILGVATGALRNWRSEIGKAGLRVITESIKGMTKNEIVEFVAYQIPPEGQVGRFIYGQPDNKPGQCEAWLSSLILETFAWHIAVMMKVKTSEHYPFGALALCAASVEHALRHWQTGVCEEIPFSDSLWGAATDGYT